MDVTFISGVGLSSKNRGNRNSAKLVRNEGESDGKVYSHLSVLVKPMYGNAVKELCN